MLRHGQGVVLSVLLPPLLLVAATATSQEALPVPDATPRSGALDPLAAGPAGRAWSPNGGGRVLFRRCFELPKGVTEARVVFSCDDGCKVWVNGALVGATNAWTDVTVVDLEQLGEKNVVAIDAFDNGGAAALACWILWRDRDGNDHDLVTDTSWRCSDVEIEGWRKLDFDDRTWVAPKVDLESEFARNIYNLEPTNVHFRNRFSIAADAIAQALQELRTARGHDAALRALDAIERAAIEGRAAILRRERAARGQPDERR